MKNYYENDQKYYELLEDINKIIDMFNGEKEENKKDNKLMKDFDIIINYCIPFLGKESQNKIIDDFKLILMSEKEKISNYLENTELLIVNPYVNIKNKYSSYNEFEIGLRKRIHLILIELNTKVNKRDIELEIEKGLKNIIENIFKESENKILLFRLKEINRSKQEIENLLIRLNNQDAYILKLKGILSKDIDYSKDIIGMLDDINNIIISLYKLKFEIEEQLTREKNYNNRLLRFRFKTK